MSTNIFNDQAKFMTACGQTVGSLDQPQYDMYLTLIEEEFDELTDAVAANDTVEQLDALLDILVVTIGALHSAGFDAQGGWDEVLRSNMSKVDIETGKVIRREDGKILKPESYSPPDLTPFVTIGY